MSLRPSPLHWPLPNKRPFPPLVPADTRGEAVPCINVTQASRLHGLAARLDRALPRAKPPCRHRTTHS